MRGLWAGADVVVFNGDTAETRAQRTYDESMHRVAELRRAAAEDGVELILIAGNHDPLIVDRDWVHLADGAVVATHGDLIHPEIAPWAEENKHLKRDTERVLGKPIESAGLSERANAAKRASVRAWRRLALEKFTKSDSGFWRRRWRQTGTCTRPTVTTRAR